MGYLRLTGGCWRGRKIFTPPGAHVRPMQDFLRKAIFDILRGEEKGAMIADIFAGSGSIGLEALSRGARGAVFVEKNHRVREVLRKNIALCGIEDKSIIWGIDFFKIKSFHGVSVLPDITFLDPPFAADHHKVLQAMKFHSDIFKRSLVVYRFPVQYGPYVNEEVLRVHTFRRYGESLLVFGEVENNASSRGIET